jgi:hypothetical protein
MTVLVESFFAFVFVSSMLRLGSQALVTVWAGPVTLAMSP